jgi:hypothetical protein
VALHGPGAEAGGVVNQESHVIHKLLTSVVTAIYGSTLKISAQGVEWGILPRRGSKGLDYNEEKFFVNFITEKPT